MSFSYEELKKAYEHAKEAVVEAHKRAEKWKQTAIKLQDKLDYYKTENAKLKAKIKQL